MDALSDARSPSASPAQARPPSLGFFAPAKARAIIAATAGVPEDWTTRVAAAHRLALVPI